MNGDFCDHSGFLQWIVSFQVAKRLWILSRKSIDSQRIDQNKYSQCVVFLSKICVYVKLYVFILNCTEFSYAIHKENTMSLGLYINATLQILHEVDI